ncbi:MAG: hypothetical protein IKO19_08780 [Candidatus Riflebacteria bacterium]|nr:hypothetical protein [Candidatus Riflebacteria bacterium]
MTIIIVITLFFLIAFAPLTIFHRVMKLWKLLVIIFCFGLLAFLLMPNSPRCVKSGNRDRHCFSNIRMLRGAIELYNMDHNESMHELTKTSIEKLIQGNYLKSVSKDEECEYKSKGELDFDKKDSGFIYCTYHGDIDGYLESKRFQDDKKRIPQNCSIEEFNAAKKEIIKKKEMHSFLENCKIVILIGIMVILYLSCFFDKAEPETNL